MRNTCFLWLSLAAILSVGAPVVRAQDEEFGDQARKTDTEETPKQKTPSFFHRPAKGSAAEEMAYARGLAGEGRTRKAIRQYDDLVRMWPSAPEAVKAQRAEADLLLESGNDSDAFDAYQYLVDFFPGRFDLAEVLDRQFQIANLVMSAKHPRFFLFGSYTSPEKAIPMLDKIVKNAPDWERAPEAQYLVGWIHEQRHDYEEAIAAYESVGYAYPASDYAAAASLGRADCLQTLARKNPRDEDTLKQALSALSGFLRDYPNDPNADRVQTDLDKLKGRLADMFYRKAAFYDRLAHRPAAALIAYRSFLRRFPYSDKAEVVSARIALLQAQVEKQDEKTR